MSPQPFIMRSTAAFFLISLIAIFSSKALGGAPLVSQAWYAGRYAKDFPPSQVSWSKYTHMTYAFAAPTNDIRTLGLENSEPDTLVGFVKTAKANSVKALLSIGGYSGSIYWSSAVGSSQNRTAFVKTVTDYAVQYDLDGLDFVWEFPDRRTLGCNIVDPNDTSNFISFLEELRQHPIGQCLTLTAGVSIAPYNDATGKPSTDLSRLANVLDYIVLLNYNIWGPWFSSVGPNAPLNDTCAAPANQRGSGVRAVAQWHEAGVPYEKILLGLPTYGHSYSVKKTDAFKNGSTTELAEYPAFNHDVHPAGDRWDDPAGFVDPCGVSNPAAGEFSVSCRLINFWGLIENGFLNEDGTPEYPHRFDQCSKGAFVYDPDKEVMVSYDSVESWAAKGKYIASAGLGGFAIWQAGGDYHDLLLDSVHRASGM
ncbi:hypothetical protein V5O48_009460 [Marasmius crinis-equi]|uniref:GH18 domain-containing protein n=1 Tax=Marasmius crinis-equi TaxID=585013 RepID=A0ABR3FB57_9AGAR